MVTDTSTPSMYDRIGGSPTVRAAVDRLYAWIARDDELWVNYFQGVDLPTVKGHMVKLLSQTLGGPKQYSGRDLKQAHAHLNIKGSHYDRVVDYVLASLLVAHAPRDVMAAVEGVLLDLRPQLCTSEESA